MCFSLGLDINKNCTTLAAVRCFMVGQCNHIHFFGIFRGKWSISFDFIEYFHSNDLIWCWVNRLQIRGIFLSISKGWSFWLVFDVSNLIIRTWQFHVWHPIRSIHFAYLFDWASLVENFIIAHFFFSSFYYRFFTRMKNTMDEENIFNRTLFNVCFWFIVYYCAQPWILLYSEIYTALTVCVDDNLSFDFYREKQQTKTEHYLEHILIWCWSERCLMKVQLKMRV